MIRPCWVSGWARQLGVVWLVEASKDLHALQPSSTHQSVLSRQQQQQQQQASKGLSSNLPICTIAPPFHQLIVVVVVLVVLFVLLSLTMSNILLGNHHNSPEGPLPPSLRIRSWTCGTSCKGRPGPHAIAVKALRTSSANQLHYALPCEKLRGILCSCPFNTDRILALKNKQKGAQLIGGFG